MEPKIKNKKEARRRRIKMRISKKYYGTADNHAYVFIEVIKRFTLK